MLPDPRCPPVQGRLTALLDHLDASPLDGRTVFITGGTGFFGYWMLSLFDLLRQRGIDVRVRLLSRNPAAFAAVAPYFSAQSWVSCVPGDVKSFQDATPADLLIHAATDTDAAAHRDPLAIMDNILLGTRHTLAHALSSGVRRVLYVSSGAVYGVQPADIEQLPESASCACDATHPDSAYGSAKRGAEQWCVQFGLEHGIAIPIARCFAFVGAGLPLNGHFAIGNFIGDALAGRPICVNGDGTPLRSYLYGADLAIWLLKILLQGTHGQAYNVGSDQAVSIRELAETVRDALCPEHAVHITRSAPDNALRSRYIPAIGRARSELDLDVWTSLEQAIRLTAACATPHQHA
ncbi:NAD(P)-dependent oxidoreductase [Zoogloea sp.]|uniref:NAD-dependent epimerase/dehydratase family protein n=1 Tax=Zoogloea sp. TaxID=49181 RepID=UPI0025894210|nr:NAD(P)-dependent oxidoreductase [Zoogloea sp.]MDD2670156.1 NAD(P)-dependent oxidoreductase [Zoogloea sp.]